MSVVKQREVKQKPKKAHTFIKPTNSKPEDQKTSDRMDSIGFHCMGIARDLLKDLSLAENIYVWEHLRDGRQVLMSDDGGDDCTFIRYLRMSTLEEEEQCLIHA